MNIGHAIRVARAIRGLTQQELALLSGLTDSTITYVEQGKRQASVEAIEKIAAGLNLPVLHLIYLACTPEERGVTRRLETKLDSLVLKQLLSQRDEKENDK